MSVTSEWQSNKYRIFHVSEKYHFYLREDIDIFTSERSERVKISISRVDKNDISRKHGMFYLSYAFFKKIFFSETLNNNMIFHSSELKRWITIWYSTFQLWEWNIILLFNVSEKNEFSCRKWFYRILQRLLMSGHEFQSIFRKKIRNLFIGDIQRIWAEV